MSIRLENKTAVLSKIGQLSDMRSEPEEGEEGGDAGDFEPARTWRLTKISLTRKQYEQFFGEDAFRRHFNVPASGPIQLLDVDSPVMPIVATFKNGAVSIGLGTQGKPIEIKAGVRVKNISIDRREGKSERACAELRCTIQAIFPLTLDTLRMESFKGKEIRISLRMGPKEDADDAQSTQEDLVEAARVAEENATDVNSKKGGDEARLN